MSVTILYFSVSKKKTHSIDNLNSFHFSALLLTNLHVSANEEIIFLIQIEQTVQTMFKNVLSLSFHCSHTISLRMTQVDTSGSIQQKVFLHPPPSCSSRTKNTKAD